MSDAVAVTELINASCLADMGQPTVTITDLEEQWGEAGFDLKADAWVAVSAEGKVVGYEELFNRHGHYDLQGDGYVHPQYQNLGIGTALLRKLEAACMRTRDTRRSVISIGCASKWNLSLRRLNCRRDYA
jgi:GNAT superfamily N-acetyltransferase